MEHINAVVGTEKESESLSFYVACTSPLQCTVHSVRESTCCVWRKIPPLPPSLPAKKLPMTSCDVHHKTRRHVPRLNLSPVTPGCQSEEARPVPAAAAAGDEHELSAAEASPASAVRSEEREEEEEAEVVVEEGSLPPPPGRSWLPATPGRKKNGCFLSRYITFAGDIGRKLQESLFFH